LKRGELKQYQHYLKWFGKQSEIQYGVMGEYEVTAMGMELMLMAIMKINLKVFTKGSPKILKKPTK
jgi:hypothetical protein